MSLPKPMLTLSQVIAILAKERGIHREFRMNEIGEMKLQDSDLAYSPEDLKILKSYRFEGMSDPDDNSVLYVIEDQFGNKGMIIDAYGADTNFPGKKFQAFLLAIPEEDHEEYNFE